MISPKSHSQSAVKEEIELKSSHSAVRIIAPCGTITNLSLISTKVTFKAQQFCGEYQMNVEKNQVFSLLTVAVSFSPLFFQIVNPPKDLKKPRGKKCFFVKFFGTEDQYVILPSFPPFILEGKEGGKKASKTGAFVEKQELEFHVFLLSRLNFSASRKRCFRTFVKDE